MADVVQQKIKDDFSAYLKADEYVPFMNEFWKDLPDIFRFIMTYMHGVIRSGRFKGSKLLEIGSGATVHNIASASAYFPNITMSDYVLDNVESLKRWVAGQSNLPQFLDIPAGLEGYGYDIQAGRKIIESRIRKSIKRVTVCDVLSDPVLLDDDTSGPKTSPPFDMIVSCLCLEVAPKDYNGYCETLKRVSKLLRTGGGLLMCGFLQGSTWKIGDTAFNHIQIGEREVMAALTDAGFGKIDLKSRGGKELMDSDFSYEKVFCAVAEKL